MLHRRLGLLLCALAFVVGSPSVAYAQGAGAEALAAGRAAVAQSDTAGALLAFERVARDDGAVYAEAQYERARLLLGADEPDPSAARAALRRALKVRPDDVRFRTLDLERRERFPPPILPDLQTARLADRARALLALDSTNAAAHRVLGRIALLDFEVRSNLADVWLGVDERGGRGATPQQREAEARLRGLDPDQVGDLANSLDFPVTRNEAAAVRELTEAQRHLYASLRTDPAQPGVLRSLAQVYLRLKEYGEAERMLLHLREALAMNPDYWLILGTVQHRAGRADAAGLSFAEGLPLLAPEDRAAFESIVPFLTDEQRAEYDEDPAGYTERFWASRDPRLMTATNERKLEHYARLVYADLRFGEVEMSFAERAYEQRGWATDPGQVVLRYGEPPREYRRRGQFDDVSGFDYGDIGFTFMRPARVGGWTFFSPKSADPQVRRSGAFWSGDFEMKSKEWFREMPERYAFAPERAMHVVEHLATTLRGEGGGAEVIVAMRVPTEAAAAGYTAAAYLMSLHGERRAQRHRMTTPDPTLTVLTLSVDAPPGAYVLAAEFDANRRDAPVGVGRSPLDVADYTRPGLHLSEVLLIDAVEDLAALGTDADSEGLPPGWIVRGDLALAPATEATVALGGLVSFYFEAYGLTLGDDDRARYQVEAAMLPQDESRSWRDRLRTVFGRGAHSEGVSVTFGGLTTKESDGRYFVLDTDGLEPGLYLLALRLTDTVTGNTRDVARALSIAPSSNADAR